jgi:uncharacterized protein YbaR (Trm112 family)
MDYKQDKNAEQISTTANKRSYAIRGAVPVLLSAHLLTL